MASPPPMLSVETTPAPSNEVPLETPRLVRRSQSLQDNRLALLLPHDSTMASTTTALPGRPMAPRRVRSSILPSAAEEDSMLLADAVNNNSTALLDSTNIPLIPSLDSPRLNGTGATRLTLKRRDGRASLLDDYDTKSNEDDGFDLEIAALSLPHHSRAFPTANMLRTPVNATSTPPLVRFGMQAPSPVTMVQLPPPPANVMLPSPSALMTHPLPAKHPFFERSASEGTPAIVSRPRALLFPRPKTSWICERLTHRRDEGGDDDMVMFKENKKPRFNSV